MAESGEWTDNPFAAPAEEAAPFNDPSVTEASSTMPEYDPFTNNAVEAAPSTAAPKSKGGPAQVATVSATTGIGGQEPDWAQPAEAVPAKSKKENKKKAKVTKEEKKRQAEYEANQAAAANPQQKDPNFRPANWPPFPKGCYWPMKPCFHHDFKGEIPDWGYGAVRMTYYHWVAYFFALFWNFVCCCIASSAQIDGSTTSIFLALAYIVAFGLLAYSCWFQSLYQAMRKDSSLRFGWFFFTFMFQWMTAIFFLVGAEGTGAAGLIYSIDVINKDDYTLEGTIMFSSVIIWLLMILWASYIMRNVLGIYRSSGQSLQKAQKEAVTGAVTASM